MKPFLVDVPVKLNVFIRPETLRRVFSVVKEARPSVLFLVSDGPRENMPGDKKLIEESRKVVDDVDWDCKVIKYYFDKNLVSSGKGFREVYDSIFEHADRCVFLEDDVVTSVSFFRFCAELLEKYKDDLRVKMICGMNHMGSYDEPDADYFFTEAFSIWGFAYWKRTYENINDFSFADSEYLKRRVWENAKNYPNFTKPFEDYCQSGIYQYGGSVSEFFLCFLTYAQNQLNIVPKSNLVCNIGYTDGSQRAPNDLKKMSKGVQQIFNMKTYELDFPLKHPGYVVKDSNYEKNILRIMARNHPAVSFYRRIEGVTRRIYYGDSKVLMKKFFKKLRD